MDRESDNLNKSREGQEFYENAITAVFSMLQLSTRQEIGAIYLFMEHI